MTQRERIPCTGESPCQPAAMQHAKQHGRHEACPPRELSWRDGFKISCHQFMDDIAAKGQLFGQGDREDRTEYTPPQPDDGQSWGQLREAMGQCCSAVACRWFEAHPYAKDRHAADRRVPAPSPRAEMIRFTERPERYTRREHAQGIQPIDAAGHRGCHHHGRHHD